MESQGKLPTLNSINFENSSPRIHLYPNNGTKKCLECTSDLKTLYSSKSRNILTLQGEKRITEYIWICKNDDCSNFNIKIYSERMTPSGSKFAFDIILEVGRLRREEKKTFKEVIENLKSRGVDIGRSRSCAKHVFSYYEIYELLLKQEECNQQQQGQDVILSIDGAKPKKGSETLYIITNALTNEVYHDSWTLYSDTCSIEEILNQVKGQNLNVLGFVSDKQRTLLLGVQKVFGELPHQLCQFHWLQEIGKILYGLDKQINTSIKKNLRKIRQMTINTKNKVRDGILPETNLRFLQELESYLTVIFSDCSKPPFQFKSIKNWYRLKDMLSSFFELLEDHNEHVFKTAVKSLPPQVKTVIQVTRIFAEICETTLFDIKTLEIGLQWLIQITESLDPKNIPGEFLGVLPLSQVGEVLLLEYIDGLETHGNEFLEEFCSTIKKSFLRWTPQLFTCFDYPHIPRTNNKKEQLINQIKQSYSKITGRSDNFNLLRHQTSFRYTLCSPNIKSLLKFCQNVSRNAYKKTKTKVLKRINVLRKEYRIKHNFQVMWKESFKKISEVLQ